MGSRSDLYYHIENSVRIHGGQFSLSDDENEITIMQSRSGFRVITESELFMFENFTDAFSEFVSQCTKVHLL